MEAAGLRALEGASRPPVAPLAVPGRGQEVPALLPQAQVAQLTAASEAEGRLGWRWPRWTGQRPAWAATGAAASSLVDPQNPGALRPWSPPPAPQPSGRGVRSGSDLPRRKSVPGADRSGRKARGWSACPDFAGPSSSRLVQVRYVGGTADPRTDRLTDARFPGAGPRRYCLLNVAAAAAATLCLNLFNVDY